MRSPRFTRLSLALAAALFASGCGSSDDKGDAKGTKVTFNMSWLPQGSMAGVIVAIDKGYYTQAGLDVEPIRGFGGIRTVNELDQGMADFAYADPVSILMNRANGGHVRMIGTINGQWPAGLCYVTARHKLTKPADIAGLTLGGGQNSAMQELVPAWLRLNGVQPDSVRILQLDPALVATSLVEGKIDAAECWQGNSLPNFRSRAKEANVEIDRITYADFGLQMYGSGIAATEKTIAEKPEVARAFLAATYRGYADAFADPAAATAAMVKRFPMLDPAITRQQIDELKPLMQDNPQGAFQPARVAASIDFLKRAYPEKAKAASPDMFDASVVPGAAK